MIPIGVRLRAIRHRWRLSLREVEEFSVRFALERGDPSYKISATWLNRIERGTHNLTVHKLIALAEIFGLPPEDLLRSSFPGNSKPCLKQLSSPNAMVLVTTGTAEQPTECLMKEFLSLEQSPDATGLLSPELGSLPTRYLRGIIGRNDRTLEPMIPAGSIVSIDTRERSIALRKRWAHEFERPIYFLRTPVGYVCGLCELDKDSEWLTVISHPLSPVRCRNWRYRTEIESLGRVVAVAIRLAI
jgi:transcriptional regulator with XRE-family HTH domain